MENELEYDDWGHPASEVRRIPHTDNSAIIACYTHYLVERDYQRKYFNEELPAWEDLEIYRSN